MIKDKLNLTILFISHDRFFINKLATRVIVIENNVFKSYYGNYDNYKLIKKEYNTKCRDLR